MFNVESFSKGKFESRNEDCFGYDDLCFVIVDGATDKSGKLYDSKTGGEIVSKLVVKECLSTNLNGVKLVNHLNKAVSDLYIQLKILQLTKNPMYRFSCTFICGRVNKSNNKVVITSVGDLGFRINGNKIFQEKYDLEVINSERRAKFIRQTGDVKKSREHIMPFLLKNYDYQNSQEHKLGYGVIDGTFTPKKFVKSFEFSLNKLRLIELFSDGYFAIPNSSTIRSWENLHKKIEETDPDKWITYKSTKSKDDRTIIIVKIKD